MNLKDTRNKLQALEFRLLPPAPLPIAFVRCDDEGNIMRDTEGRMLDAHSGEPIPKEREAGLRLTIAMQELTAEDWERDVLLGKAEFGGDETMTREAIEQRWREAGRPLPEEPGYVGSTSTMSVNPGNGIQTEGRDE